MPRNRYRYPLAGAMLALCLPVLALAESEVRIELDDERPARANDPTRALPQRGTGEAVLGGRDAFDRDTPQFQISRRSRSSVEAAAERGVQLAGNDRTLRHECEVGERVELVGNNNIVDITGLCVGLHIEGDNNTVAIEVVDELRIDGDRNDIRWQRGFTVDRPNLLETNGRNSVAQQASTSPEAD